MKKYFIVGMLTASMLMPMFAGAQSTADLQAQITALMAQITTLQAQLQAQQGGGTTVAWCHTFKRNLGMGAIGDETRDLQKALLMEGFTADMQNGHPLATYKDATAAAVSGFQQKYKDEILTPFGLTYGTGFAGPSTRAKLNELYGCEGKVTVNTNPSPVPTKGPIPSLSVYLDQNFLYPKEGYVVVQNYLQMKIVQRGSGITYCPETQSDCVYDFEVSIPGSETSVFSLRNGESKIVLGARIYLLSISGSSSGVSLSMLVKRATDTVATSTQSSAPILISPYFNAILDNGRIDRYDSMIWDFDWSDVPGATAYHLYVTKSGANPVIDNQNLSQSSFHYNSDGGYITGGNETGWSWKVQALVNGTWGNWSEVRPFIAEPVNIDPPSTNQSSLKLLSPNGGDNYSLGGTQTATWSGGGSDWTVNLMLQNGSGYTARVVTSVPVKNTGYTQWVVPTDLPAGNYKIRIACSAVCGNLNVPQTQLYDDSDGWFYIGSGQTNAGTITFISPLGGESYPAGTPKTVQWSSAGFVTDYIRIMFYPDSVHPFDGDTTGKISDFYITGNPGSYNLPVPAYLPTANYRIALIACSSVSGVGILCNDVRNGNRATTESNVFTIVSGTVVTPSPSPTATSTQSSITIISPNGGENLTVGQTYQIRWSTPNSGRVVRLHLFPWGRPDLAGILINGDVMPSDIGTSDQGATSFNWTVPSGIPELWQQYGIPRPTGYGIRALIGDVNGQVRSDGPQDSSNGPFIISAPSITDTTPPTISITSPAAGTNYSANQTLVISANATDNIGISRVVFSGGTSLMGPDQTDTTYPYSISVPITSGSAIGGHCVFAFAYDAAGNQASSGSRCFNVVASPVSNLTAEDITPPTVSIIYPSSTMTYSAGQTATVTASASDVSGISKVEFADSGALKFTATSSPYQFSMPITSATPTGQHAWFATAYDKAGNHTTAGPRYFYVGGSVLGASTEATSQDYLNALANMREILLNMLNSLK